MRSGKKAIAFSTSPDGFPTVGGSLDRVWDYIQSRKLLEAADLLNVNIAPPADGTIFWTRQAGPYFRDRYESRGGDLLQAVGYSVWKGTFDPELDLDVVMNGHISVTPLSVNRTDRDAFRKIREQN